MHCEATEWSTDAQQYCDIVNIFFSVAAASDKKKKKNLDIKKKLDVMAKECRKLR